MNDGRREEEDELDADAVFAKLKAMTRETPEDDEEA